MAKFTFTLPNGQLFTLVGPDGATQAQAEKIYLEQLAAGAFIGLRSGDQLQSRESMLIQFSQSRLDRGTAGVPDTPLLAIYKGGALGSNQTIISSLPVLADVPITNGITVADYVDQSTVPEGIGPLTAPQVQAVMAAVAASVCQPAEVATDELGVGKYGLSGQQLEDSGHLKCGTTARFLGQQQTTGLTDVLKSPSVWTGKDGVTSMGDLLKNPPLQDKIQFGLMKSSFDTLVETGQIIIPGTDLKAPTGSLYSPAANAGTGLVSPDAGLKPATGVLGGVAATSLASLSGSTTTDLPGAISNLTGGGSISGNLGSISALASRGTAELGGLLANASKFGVGNALDWAKGSSSATNAISGISGLLSGGTAGLAGALGAAASALTSGLKSQMDSLAKQGQFAVNFSDFKLPAAVAGVIPAAGFKGTIDRSTLNAATAKLIGSDKIALPKFSPQSIDTSALTDAASKAKGLLSGGLDANGLLSKASGSLSGALSGASGALSSAINSVTGGANPLSSVVGKLPYTGTDSITLGRLGKSPDPLTALKSKIG